MDVLQVLKEDANGTVLKAWDPEHERPIIVKKLPRNDRALLEGQILSELCHPAIPKLLNSFAEDDTVYLVLEFKKGRTLAEYLETARFSEDEAIEIVRQLVSVLMYLHVEKKIIHRDIKLENIILDETHKLSLVDFGFADYMTDYMTERLGSPAYCSPEIILGQRYSAPTDVWSMAVVIYALLNGYPPFYGNSIEEVFTAICYTQAPVGQLVGVSTDCKIFLTKLFRKNQNERLSIEEAAKHPWLTGKHKACGVNEVKSLKRKSLPILRPRVVHSAASALALF